MRTTVEITDRQRARLLEIAAHRGEKGFSSIVQEAIDHYLVEVERQTERRQRAIEVLGTLDENAATELRSAVQSVRSRWR